MTDYSIVGICQIYNEIEKGNLERYIHYLLPHICDLIIYDDGSTDGSDEYLQQFTEHILRSDHNDFCNEMNHKEQLVRYAKSLDPDYILWLDADEVLSQSALEELPKLCEYCITHDIDAVSFHELNLWRSHSWRRMDNLYNDGWFVRLWRMTPELGYDTIQSGLHQTPYPTNITKIMKSNAIQVIHYGFASDEALARKFITYRKHGQSGYLLYRFLEEKDLSLEKVPEEIFPQGLWIDDDPPRRRGILEALVYTERYHVRMEESGRNIVGLLVISVLRYIGYRIRSTLHGIANPIFCKIVTIKKGLEVKYYP